MYRVGSGKIIDIQVARHTSEKRVTQVFWEGLLGWPGYFGQGYLGDPGILKRDTWVTRVTGNRNSRQPEPNYCHARTLKDLMRCTVCTLQGIRHFLCPNYRYSNCTVDLTDLIILFIIKFLIIFVFREKEVNVCFLLFFLQRYCRGTFTKSYKKTIGVDFLEKQLRVQSEEVTFKV